jgi:N-acetylglutamate synthase-like GNAT family acetyltransferase
VDYERVTHQTREEVNEFIRRHWLTDRMIVRGEEVDMTIQEGFAARGPQGILGLAMYRIQGDACEILSLDSLCENRGTGTALVGLVLQEAEKNGCRRVVVITTNDNIRAIRFYQKRGFDLTRLYHNALEVSRRYKPQIPLLGEEGIPLRHELEFQYDLTEKTPKDSQ